MRNFGQATRRLARKSGIGLTVALLVAGIFGAPVQTYGQSDNNRKLVTRVEPEYPDALKKLYIGGVVRVEVMVAPNGTVRSTKLLGGSPILGQSTMKAVKQWKYVPAAADETLTVKVEFDPHK
ncbi:MAG TPA: energy transducer TonB [Candidatus Dormibacteraeota bacterium]|nr:energy transducer TonB [Candidatus Dormibacteraeota bacterium]